MKTTSSLFFFFLLFAFTTRALNLLDSDGDLDLVDLESDLDLFDSDGDPLRNGGQYNFSPADSVGGGVIVAAAVRWGTTQYCNLAVAQFPGSRRRSITVRALHRLYYLRTFDRKYIKFSSLASNGCTNSSYWVVSESQPLGKSVMLATSPHSPHRDPIVGRWFHIRPYDTKYYKLVFCEDSGQDCRNIGIHIDDEGYGRLVVTDNNPLIFKLDKVKESFHSDILMMK